MANTKKNLPIFDVKVILLKSSLHFFSFGSLFRLAIFSISTNPLASVLVYCNRICSIYLLYLLDFLIFLFIVIVLFFFLYCFIALFAIIIVIITNITPNNALPTYA